MGKKNKLFKKIIVILLGIMILSVIGVSIFLKVSLYQPSEDATTAVAEASVVDEKNWLEFKAQGEAQKLNVIFYQGALVEAESYSLWAQELAMAGYNVYLLKSPAALAVLKLDLAAKVIEQHPSQAYVVGGHSLGGVIASRFAHNNLADKELKGVFFLASCPDQKGSLVESELSVLSIRGGVDGVLNQARYDEAKSYLPTATEYLEISGGNHAGFGSYGAQKGDNEALISNQRQQQEVAENLLKWLATLR